MAECICIDCINRDQCQEFNANCCSDNSYYEWTKKYDKCEKEISKGKSGD